jgi:antitoxin ParD1/3/4
MMVSLPDPVKDWVETQVHSGRYATCSDDIHGLILQDRKQELRLAQLRKFLAEAEASGISPRTIDEIFADAQAQARARGVL